MKIGMRNIKPYTSHLRESSEGPTEGLDQKLFDEIATSHTSSKRIRSLIRAGANVNARNKEGRTPLQVAAYYRNMVAIRTLIEQEADVNAKDSEGCTALWWVTLNGRTEAVRLLVQAGADVNIRCKGSDLLGKSVVNGHRDITKILIEAGADPRTSFQTLEDLDEFLKGGRHVTDESLPDQWRKIRRSRRLFGRG